MLITMVLNNKSILGQHNSKLIDALFWNLILPFNKLISLHKDKHMLRIHSTERKHFQETWYKQKKI